MFVSSTFPINHIYILSLFFSIAKYIYNNYVFSSSFIRDVASVREHFMNSFHLCLTFQDYNYIAGEACLS